VQDDGIGFIRENSSGNGIGNMQKRAAECNGTFTITSTNVGTTVKLVLPVVP
jgi:signal transduction histidine kinase